MKINKFPSEVYQSCLDFGLLEPSEGFTQKKITTGVSSDIWYVETKKKKFCIKRALNKLTVKEDWFAPVDRNNFEAKYFKECKKIVPNSFPRILGHDSKKYILAMQWYDNNKYLVWKNKLLNDHVSNREAHMVARILIKIHNFFYGKKKFEKEFLNDKTFHAIRIEPYILFTSNSYPQFKKNFISVANSLVRNKKTLIHGDFSPKNILLGKSYPVILDAETACWGDPVFDLAFCLNHIVLKSIYKNNKIEYLELGKNFIETYLKYLNYEKVDSFLNRFFSILPLFILARIDGKSPVEYFNEKHKQCARNFGAGLLGIKKIELSNFFEEWNKHL